MAYSPLQQARLSCRLRNFLYACDGIRRLPGPQSERFLADDSLCWHGGRHHTAEPVEQSIPERSACAGGRSKRRRNECRSNNQRCPSDTQQSLCAAVDRQSAIPNRATLCYKPPISAITALKLLFGSSTAELNQLPTQYLSLGNQLLQPVANPFYGVITSGALSGATIPYGQLLRPYPEYTGVESVQPPIGFSSYNALALSANHRFSNGLQFLASFTWSKYLTNSEGPEGWTQRPGAVGPQLVQHCSGERV